MAALLLQNGLSKGFSRHHVESGSGDIDEKWLQDVLFRNPSLVPMEEIELGIGEMVPLCRELTLPSSSNSVFLDILGVTRSGRLCLIQCKLWRNPQARREVIAQTLEYAALLRTLSYGDLSAKLTAKGLPGENPIFTAARNRWPEINEGAFVDAVSRSLPRGDFQLMIAGDGIRSDLHTIAAHLEHSGLAAARFSLIEIQLWRGDDGPPLIVPRVPVRTEIIQHRVLVTATGDVAHIVEEQPLVQEAGPADAGRARNRAFFEGIINDTHFDHPGPAKTETWRQAASRTAIYHHSTVVAKFLLLVAGHDSAPDGNNPGLIVHRRKGLAPTMRTEAWRSDINVSVEHVSPRSRSNGWDANIYEPGQEAYDRLGNLTLLPIAENSYVSNRPWAHKRLLYSYFSSATQPKRRPLKRRSGRLGLVSARAEA